MRIPAIKFIGSAISHFQSEPLMYDGGGKPIVVSDWELEVERNLNGRRNHIRGVQRSSAFPHFLKYKERYVEKAAELGENMFRFSLNFPRLCPREGEFNARLMADYMKVLALIRTQPVPMEPMLVLYHWPMPLSLIARDRSGGIRKGGWEDPAAVRHFRWYIENAIGFLTDKENIKEALRGLAVDNATKERVIEEGLARYFISINEPESVLLMGYLTAEAPPFKRLRFDTALKVVPRLVEAHDIAAEAVREHGGMVGAAHQWPYFDGVFGGLLRSLEEWTTRQFERNGNFTDFIGLQYYFRMTLPLLNGRGRRMYSDNPLFGDVYPQGMGRLLGKMHAQYPSKRILVTEFGFSDKSDLKRPYWILETIRSISEAAEKGVPVDGMLFWSLVDNFEWILGMDQKFGLFNETNLASPLAPSSGGVRSWEVWKAVVDAAKNPSPETEAALDRCYKRAKEQYPSADRLPLV